MFLEHSLYIGDMGNLIICLWADDFCLQQ